VALAKWGAIRHLLYEAPWLAVALRAKAAAVPRLGPPSSISVFLPTEKSGFSDIKIRHFPIDFKRKSE
jgi:hypothetical protein